MVKNKQLYTTIQITKEMNNHIRQFCIDNGLITSTITEKLWSHYISSSMSGSIFSNGISL